ncbi:MAG: tetratricopeptide repeat protein [bacterium]
MRKLFILIFIAMIFSVSGCGDQYPAEKLYWKANKYSESIFKNPKGTPQTQYNKAVRLFEKIKKKYPNLVQAKHAQFRVAELYMAKEDYPQAIKEFTEVLKKYPDDRMLASSAQFSIGNAYEKSDQWDKALKEYRKLFEDYHLTQTGLDAPIYIASYYDKNNKTAKAQEAYRQAVRDYKKVVSENPESQAAYIAHNHISSCYMALKEWDNAIAAFGDVMEKYPGSPRAPQAMVATATIYDTELENEKKAVELYKKFIEHYPKHGMVYVVKGRLEELEKK